MKRDTILVAGAFASGKTYILNYLRGEARKRGIPFEQIPLSDSHTILERMLEDDQFTQGRNHYHVWCPGEIHGHSHDREHPTIPFTLAGNVVAHAMIHDYFEELRDLPYDGQLRFAEWGGGVNTNDCSDPAQKTDLSFQTVGRMLRDGKLPNEGLRRVIAVIHPKTSDLLRMELNSGRHLPSQEEIRLGTASWPINATGMKITGDDDFDLIEGLFVHFGCPIYTAINDGSDRFREQLQDLANGLFSPCILREISQPGGRFVERR